MGCNKLGSSQGISSDVPWAWARRGLLEKYPRRPVSGWHLASENPSRVLVTNTRKGWGKVIMISQSVEISIAGGVEEMLHAYISGLFFFFFFFCNHAFIVSVTKSLMQCEL